MHGTVLHFIHHFNFQPHSMSTVYCTSKAFTDALKALPGRGSPAADDSSDEFLRAIIDEFVQTLCKDYQMGEHELARVGSGNVKDQYVLLQGTGAARVYALRSVNRLVQLLHNADGSCQIQEVS